VESDVEIVDLTVDQRSEAINVNEYSEIIAANPLRIENSYNGESASDEQTLKRFSLNPKIRKLEATLICKLLSFIF
jgi:hypothetical protein